MTPRDFLGKEVIHDQYGKVLITDIPKGSKKTVNAIITQRGKGWDEFTESYKMFSKGAILQSDGTRSLQWGFTNNDDYGVKIQTSIDNLKLGI